MIRIKSRFVNFVKLCKWLYAPLALFFIVITMWQARFFMRDAWLNSQHFYFVVAVMFWMVAYLFSPWFMSIILHACGSEVPYRENLDLHLSYLPARYLPGGVWHTVARVSGLHRLGVHPSHLTSLVVIENLVAVSVSFITGGFFIGFYQQNIYIKFIIFMAASSSLFVLILCPFFVDRFILKGFFEFNYKKYIIGILVAIIFWTFASFSFLLYILSFFASDSLFIYIQIMGVYLFSWSVGFVSIFAPQGVGIFEIVAANLIPISLQFSVTVGIVAGFRLVVMLADLFMWIIWKTFRFYLKP